MNNKNISPICVSLGPGDPELVTLKALKALQQADIIFCPATQSAGKSTSRAKEILDDMGIEEGKIRLFTIPMMKERDGAKQVYREIADEIASLYHEGKNTAFVAEGDSGFYSSVHYIADKLEEMGINVCHVAGVPAFIACGALAGIHIVKQNERLSVFPSHVAFEEIKEEINNGRSVVLMKLSRQKEAIKKAIEVLPEAQFHYFENIGIKEKEFYSNNAEEIIKREFPYFSTLIIKMYE